jgi:hypothetical protein
MAAAVRSHDQRRALALSAAFDALPDARRLSVYAGAGSRGPRPGAVGWRTWSPQESASRGGRRRKRNGDHAPAVRKRFLVALFAVPAAAVLLLSLTLKNHHETGPVRGPQWPVVESAAPTGAAAPTAPS